MKSWKLIYLIVYICLSADVKSQNVEWVAYAPTVVETNTSFIVEFSLSNAKGTDFQAPNFNGLKIIAGPSIQQNYTSINGVSSSSFKYSYHLMAPTEGSFSIGSAGIKVNGKTYKTKELIISAKKSKEIPADKNFSLLIELDKENVYVGEQVTLTLSIYAKERFSIRAIENFPALDGFIYEELIQTDNETQIKLQGNQTLRHNKIKSIALYPQKSGILNIDPVMISIETYKEGGRGFGFFGFMDADIVSLVSNSVQLKVNPLPTPVPKHYTGITGETEFQYHLTSQSTSVNEAISLVVDIKTDSNADFITIPEYEGTESYDIYKPKILIDEKNEQRDKIISHKRVEYLIVPKKAGEITLSPEFIIFDTKKGKYTELFDKVITIQVSERSNFAGELETNESSDNTSVQNPNPIYIAAGIGLIALTSLLIFIFFRKQKTSKLSKLSSQELIAKRYEKLKNQMETDFNPIEFTEEAYKTLCSVIYEKNIDHYIEVSELQNKIKNKYTEETRISILQFAQITEKAIFAKYCPQTKSEIFNQLNIIIDNINSHKNEYN